MVMTMHQSNDLISSERYNLPDYGDNPTVWYAGEIHYKPINAGDILSFTNNHSHIYYEFLLIEEGNARIIVNENEYHLRKDDICIIKPGQVHFMEAADLGDLRICYLAVDRIWPDELLLVFENLEHSIIPDCGLLANDILQIIQESRDSLYGATEIIRLLANVWLYKLARKITGPVIKIFPSRFSPAISLVIGYLEIHARHGLSIKEIADEIGLSESRLKHKFSEEAKMPLGQYIIKMVMLRAYRLLETGHLSIKDVADKLEYPSALNFSNAFKQHWKISPMQVKQHDI